MNNEPKTTIPAEQESESSSINEAETAHLTADLQKIEGYDPVNIVSTEPVPLPAAAPDTTVNPETPPQKKSNNKWIVIGVITAVLLSVGIGGWVTYALWYQNPSRVLNDALYNIVTSKTGSLDGTVVAELNGGDIASVNINGQGGYKEGASGSAKFVYEPKGGNKYEIAMDGIRTSGGDFYFKLSNLQKAYDSFKKQGSGDENADQYAAIYDAIINPIIKKIDNQWLSFVMSDLDKYDKKLADEYTCANKVISDLGTNKDQLVEMATIYQKHKVLTVKENLGEKNGNLGFVVEANTNEYKAMSEELQNTKFAKAIKACSKQDSGSDDTQTPSKYSKNSDSSSEAAVARTEIWIDKWSHQLKHIVTTFYKDKQSGTADFTFSYNQPVTVSVPKGAKPLKDVIPSVGGLTTTTNPVGSSNSGSRIQNKS
jgi:hypothetical protein